MYNNDDQTAILREKAIFRYVQALDQGDIEGVAAVLEEALNDPELDQAIAEINLAYYEEEQLTPIAADAEFVRNLVRQHLPSAFETHEADDKPLTVGDVAARLQADRRVPPADQEVNQHLLNSSIPLPVRLNIQAVKRLATELKVTASERFWRTFRDTAIMLGMGRSHQQAQLSAAREERARYVTRKPNEKATTSSDTTPEQEEKK